MYVDAKRETYNDLGFKRFGLLGTLWTVFSKKGRDATAEVTKAYYLVLSVQLLY